MNDTKWTTKKIEEWVSSQSNNNYWYQSIPVKDGIVTPGTTNSMERVRLLNLPDDLCGKSVLDIGCNSGLLAIECKKRNADRVVGIDLETHRLEQGRTLCEIMDLDIEFKDLNLFDAAELGRFDYVFCIAIVTEVTDLLRALEVLKQVSKGVLYLELATVETFPLDYKFLGISLNSILEFNLNRVLGRIGPKKFRSHLLGTAKLRRIQSSKMNGWSLIPDMKFVKSILGEQFNIEDLGVSVRYNLLKLTAKNISEREQD